MTEEQIKTLARNMCEHEGGNWEAFEEEWTRATRHGVEHLANGVDPTALGEAVFKSFHREEQELFGPKWDNQSEVIHEDWQRYATFITAEYLLTPRDELS